MDPYLEGFKNIERINLSEDSGEPFIFRAQALVEAKLSLPCQPE